jgi:hypothetical protein
MIQREVPLLKMQIQKILMEIEEGMEQQQSGA